SVRGARLGPVPPGVRPVSDRAREGLFSSLGDRVLDAEVLDLFAGTGALGIEALSRGADRATFVESDGRAVAAIRRNVSSVGLQEQAVIRQRPVLPFLRSDLRTPRAPALAFLDPPYSTPVGDVERALHLLGGVWECGGSWRGARTRRGRDGRIGIPVDRTGTGGPVCGGSL